ncbi:MAG TPA: hypothetical protein VF006_23955 [Longimicrobium sp.]
MPSNPTLLGRMYAWLQGEVPAATLEAYRRTGLHVFELLDQAEARRLACATEGMNAWTAPPAARAQLLCTWNAFVLQTLADQILDADYAAEPVTAGFVPPETAEQVLAFYGQVEEWLNRALQARASPDYRLDVVVPAQLPPWTHPEPCPAPHVRGTVQAMLSVGHHAGAAMGIFDDAVPDDARQQAQLNRIRQVYAAAEARARYAADLYGVEPARGLHEKVGPYAREALEAFYELGQLIADPTLATPPSEKPGRVPGSRGGGRAGALPGKAGFDPWCLTDPIVRKALGKGRRANEALRRMWALDPDPALTLEIHAEIAAAYERMEISYAMHHGERVGHHECCPWAPVYVVLRPVTLGGKALRTLQQFVYDVGADDASETFRRRILVGTFRRVPQG